MNEKIEESCVAKVIKKMEENNKVQTLSFAESAKIDSNLADGLKKIKSDFECKDKNSRAFIANLELRSFQ